jgi:hypothetical protein
MDWENLKGSDEEFVQHSKSMGFWTSTTSRNFNNFKKHNVSETGYVSVFR